MADSTTRGFSHDGTRFELVVDPHTHWATLLHPDCALQMSFFAPSDERVEHYATIHNCDARGWALGTPPPPPPIPILPLTGF
jgi:hypothetical protein